jgi:hypothetical protein
VHDLAIYSWCFLFKKNYSINKIEMSDKKMKNKKAWEKARKGRDLNGLAFYYYFRDKYKNYYN